ncbi:MAG: hypothetical protein JW797_20445 [Bradymonadales bacterium]|nr:hypothetical protein [Bradymonadales bacterium]
MKIATKQPNAAASWAVLLAWNLALAGAPGFPACSADQSDEDIAAHWLERSETLSDLDPIGFPHDLGPVDLAADTTPADTPSDQISVDPALDGDEADVDTDMPADTGADSALDEMDATEDLASDPEEAGEDADVAVDDAQEMTSDAAEDGVQDLAEDLPPEEMDLAEDADPQGDAPADIAEELDSDEMELAEDLGTDAEDVADDPDIPIDFAVDVVPDRVDGAVDLVVEEDDEEDGATAFTCGDPLVDERDDMVYATVLIGTQCWMAQNLDVGAMVSGASAQTDNDLIEKYCHGDLAENCEIYGGLYQWNELMDYSPSDAANPSTTQGICPEGWHIPSDEEFKVTEMALGMTQEEADQENTWRGVGVGTAMLDGGSSGFDALLSGRRKPYSPYFDLLGYQEYTYTSTEYGANYAWRRCFYISYTTVGRWNTLYQSYGFSVRCVQD